MAITPYMEGGIKKYEVYVNGNDARGRRVQRRKRCINSLRRAETIEFEFKREVAKLKDKAFSYRWHEWFDECIRRMKMVCQPSTVISYEGRIKKWIHPRWKNLELKDITKMEIHETIFEHLTGLSDNSKKTLLKMVKRIFETAVEEGVLDRNPCAGLQVKVAEVEQSVLTNSEAQVFLQEAKRTNHRFFPVWVMALETGMRSGEMMALCWSDIDFEAQTISVSKQWTNKTSFTATKTRRNRMVPISEDLLKFLKEYKLKSDAMREFVLPHLKEWENGSQSEVTREFCVSIGITSVKFHDLRATFITNLLARGVALAQVMAVVGHTQLKTTNSYLRKSGVEVKGVTDKLGYKVPEEARGAQVLTLTKKS